MIVMKLRWLSARTTGFQCDSTHLRSFRREGNDNGEFQYPTGIAYDSLGNIVVADSLNEGVQVFNRNGKFLSKFGEQGSLDNQLKFPHGLSING